MEKRSYTPFVSIITVNYNGTRFLKSCLDSLCALEYPRDRIEVIMVDNGSTDGSVDFVAQGYPRVRIVKNDVNNYCRANNLGIRAAKGEFIALINNDVRVEQGWLTPLVECMKRDERIGAVGSKILFEDGTVASVGHQEFPNFYWVDVGFEHEDREEFNGEREVASICGCSVLYRRQCLDAVGPFDEDFTMFLEDVDMSLRCRQKGWVLKVCPSSRLYHASHGTIGSEYDAKYWQESNRLLLIAKHWPEKLADALMGEGFFTVKNKAPDRGLRDISEVLARTVSKLFKEHDRLKASAVSEQLFRAAGRIYGLEKQQMFYEAKEQREVLAEKDVALGALQRKVDEAEQKVGEAGRVISEKDQELRFKDGQLDVQARELAEKEGRIAAAMQEVSLRERRIAELSGELGKNLAQIEHLRDEVAVRQKSIADLERLLDEKEKLFSEARRQYDELNQEKKEEIAGLNAAISELNRVIIDSQKAFEDQEAKFVSLIASHNKLILDLGVVRQELNLFYSSTGYRLFLRPLWSILWPVKRMARAFLNRVRLIRARFQSYQLRQLAVRWGVYRFYENIRYFLAEARELAAWFSGDISLRRVYRSHLARNTFPVMPKRLNLMINRCCNLECVFCDLPHGRKDKPAFMKTEHAIAVIDAARRLGIAEVVLTGGEPLLHPGLFEIIAQAKAHGLCVILTTNGTLIKKNIERIRAAGIDFISVSIDGSEQTHDALRNAPGTYRQAMEGLQLLKGAASNITVNCVVTNRNIFELEQLFEFCLKEDITICFLPVVNKPELFLTDPESLAAYSRLISRMYAKGRISSYELRYLKDAASLYFKQKDMNVRCLGLNTEFGVDTDGTISPCCVWENKKADISDLGNAFSDDLEQLWHSSRFRAARLSVFHQGCKNCFNAPLYDFRRLTGLGYVLEKAVALPAPPQPAEKSIQKPTHIHMRFTTRCNLSCKHCDIWQTNKSDVQLDAIQWRLIIDKLHRWLGSYKLDLAGGEILLYKEAVELIRYAADKGVVANLTTNATLIDDATARKLVTSGLNAINISLDGLARTHVYTRNRQDVYERVQQAVLNLLKHRTQKTPYISLATVITKYNLDELRELVKLAESWALDAITFQVLDNNFSRTYDDQWFTTNEFWPDDQAKLDAVFEELFRLKSGGSRIWNPIEQLGDMRRYYRDPLGSSERPCISGDKNFIVDEAGGVRLCWNLPAVGSLVTGDPAAIWWGAHAGRRRDQIYGCLRTCRMLNCNY